VQPVEHAHASPALSSQLTTLPIKGVGLDGAGSVETTPVEPIAFLVCRRVCELHSEPNDPLCSTNWPFSPHPRPKDAALWQLENSTPFSFKPPQFGGGFCPLA